MAARTPRGQGTNGANVSHVRGWSVRWLGRSRSDGRTDGIIVREGRWLVAQKPVWTAAAERFSCQKPEATAAAAITSDLGARKSES